MGGYGQFVWSSFLLVTGIVVVNIVLARRSLRDALVESRKRIAMAQEA
jgi:heme exporter protein CcmD